MTAWPTPRILFALAGTVTLLSVTLAASVSNGWLVLTAFVGANQLLYVATGSCPASWAINRLRATGSVPTHPEEASCSSTTTR